MGYFYEKKNRNMSFEVESMHKTITIEIYCDCEKIQFITIWLKNESFSGTVKMREYLEKIEGNLKK